jgi:CO/xanthine dehydrogenase FAD-binding subunit
VVVGTTLTENDVSQAIEALAESVTSPDDIHATKKYRKYLAGKLLSKSLVEAKERAQKRELS